MSESDSAIADAVRACLDANLSLPRGEVRVYVLRGWVTLSGQLDWEWQRTAAEYGVIHLRGVIGLTNCITVAPPEEHDLLPASGGMLVLW